MDKKIDENKDLKYEKLEKKIKVLEERLNNYSFLINLSQVLKIDKTIVKEVETYKAKSMLYDRLQSGTQNEKLILKTDYNSLIAKASKKELVESKYMFNYVDNSVKPNPLSNPRKVSDVYDKLGKLEDLEEQLGCPLEVVFKALTNGVYYEDVANCMKYMVVDLHLNLEGEYVLFFDDEEYLLTKNYKKTWWLRKDKSE